MTDREQVLDEIARCFARAAVDRLLVEADQSAAGSDQDRQRREARAGLDVDPARLPTCPASP